MPTSIIRIEADPCVPTPHPEVRAFASPLELRGVLGGVDLRADDQRARNPEMRGGLVY
jgi:hypothetical protein